jgi:hypothetical protein
MKTADLTNSIGWCPGYIAWEQTAEKNFLGTDTKETPIAECLAVTKERVLPLLTRQGYSVHVTIR